MTTTRKAKATPETTATPEAPAPARAVTFKGAMVKVSETFRTASDKLLATVAAVAVARLAAHAEGVPADQAKDQIKGALMADNTRTTGYRILRVAERAALTISKMGEQVRNVVLGAKDEDEALALVVGFFKADPINAATFQDLEAYFIKPADGAKKETPLADRVAKAVAKAKEKNELDTKALFTALADVLDGADIAIMFEVFGAADKAKALEEVAEQAA